VTKSSVYIANFVRCVPLSRYCRLYACLLLGGQIRIVQ